MKIIYINHYAGGPAYGMEYRPYYLAREWVRAGHEVTVVAASESHLRSRKPVIEGDFTEEWREGIRFVWCRTPEYAGNGVGRVLNMLAFVRRVYQFRKWFQGKPDVVIASSTYPLDIYPARRIAKATGARLIWEVHDLWPLSPMELGPMSRWHPFIMLMQLGENAACKSAHAVVSMLPKADAHLREHGMQQEKFTFIPNGVDPAEWASDVQSPLSPDVIAQLEKIRQNGHFILMYAGTHGIANALDALIDAAELGKQDKISFVFVGNGYDKERLIARARAAHLENVLFLDPVPKAAIPQLLAGADALYIGWQRQSIYRFGISPNKLFDYMMSGRPIIHAVEAANDPVRDAACGYSVLPEDPQALIEAIRKMAACPATEREQMGLRGQAHVKQHHLYPVLAGRFVAVMKAE